METDKKRAENIFFIRHKGVVLTPGSKARSEEVEKCSAKCPGRVGEIQGLKEKIKVEGFLFSKT